MRCVLRIKVIIFATPSSVLPVRRRDLQDLDLRLLSEA